MDILMLGQVTNGLTSADNHFTGIRCQFAHNNLQQRGFAGTINADNVCFLMFFYMELNLVKNNLCSKGQTNLLAR